jgi:hypothetical protein
MVRRFGVKTLNAAVERADYPGLDLSNLRWTAAQSVASRTGKRQKTGLP